MRLMVLQCRRFLMVISVRVWLGPCIKFRLFITHYTSYRPIGHICAGVSLACAGMVDVTGSGMRCPIKEGETVRFFFKPAEKSQASTVKKAGALLGDRCLRQLAGPTYPEGK